MTNKRLVSRIASVGAVLTACGLAQGQIFTADFEAPAYTGGPGLGVLLTNGFGGGGQNGWYLPNTTSRDAYVMQYASNTWNVAPNPLGGAQCEVSSPSAPNFGRAQHAVNFSAGGVWTATWDNYGRYNGTLPAADNLGSFSQQDSLVAKYFQQLMTWGATVVGPAPNAPDHTSTADKYHIAYGFFTDAAPTAIQFATPGPEWRDVPVDHWIRCSVKWTFTNPPRILTCTIQDLTANGPVTIAYPSNMGWLLAGGSASALALPTDIRLFSGGGGAGTESLGNVTAWDNIDIRPSTDTSGACCLPAGGCSFGLQTACADAGGIYKGDGVTCAAANCPPPGACCNEDGTCVVTTQVTCTNQGGLYRGDNAGCASAACVVFGYNEGATDVGDLPATAGQITGPGTHISKIRGNMDLDDTDMYKFQVCDRLAFSATTVGGTALDTMLWLFDSTGHGRTMDDDSSATVPQSTISNQFVPANGTYYIAVSTFENVAPTHGRVALDGAGSPIWNPTNPGGAVFPEWAPNGPAAANVVGAWSGSTSVIGGYVITLSGACSLGCYANCDQSTAAPILNANDFQCFLNAFASQQGYANCDSSTAAPVLNANDFQCFLNAFAGGCP